MVLTTHSYSCLEALLNVCVSLSVTCLRNSKESVVLNVERDCISKVCILELCNVSQSTVHQNLRENHINHLCLNLICEILNHWVRSITHSFCIRCTFSKAITASLCYFSHKLLVNELILLFTRMC